MPAKQVCRLNAQTRCKKKKQRQRFSEIERSYCSVSSHHGFEFHGYLNDLEIQLLLKIFCMCKYLDETMVRDKGWPSSLWAKMIEED